MKTSRFNGLFVGGIGPEFPRSTWCEAAMTDLSCYFSGLKKESFGPEYPESISELHIENLLWEMKESEMQEHSDEAKVMVLRTCNSVNKGINVG